jgi:hypothetical protein
MVPNLSMKTVKFYRYSDKQKLWVASLGHAPVQGLQVFLLLFFFFIYSIYFLGTGDDCLVQLLLFSTALSKLMFHPCAAARSCTLTISVQPCSIFFYFLSSTHSTQPPPPPRWHERWEVGTLSQRARVVDRLLASIR